MISQQRAIPPADGGPLGNAEEPGRTDAAGFGGACALPFDYIDEALEEAMIASEPPVLTPQTGIGPPNRDAGPARLD